MKRCKRWSAAEDDKLLRLRDQSRLRWSKIAALLPGRTAGACEVRYYTKLGAARDRSHVRPGPKPTLPVVSWRKRGVAIAVVVQPPQAAAPAARPVEVASFVPRGHTMSTATLREHAALSARIEACGDLTRGWFGDPPPGRSALDERARAAAGAVQPSLPGEASDVG